MRYRATDLPALLRTPPGRRELRVGAFNQAWPIMSRLALVHRATRARSTRLVAVVGSLGKTTTARAVAAVLGRDPAALARNHLSFVAAAVLKIRHGDPHAVVEVGIGRAGEMSSYARVVRPNVAVVTSIGNEHHSALGSLETTRAEKAAMVRALAPSGLAVLNGDDRNVQWMATQTDAAVRTFGFGEGNDVRASDVAIDWPHGMCFTLHAGGERRNARVRLLGRHMVYPLLAAVTVALAEGVRLDDALSALEALPPTAGRLETVRLSNGAFVLRDEHKATLETIDAALDLLAEIPAERKIVVLGDAEELLGSPSEIYARLGARVAAVATRAVFVHLNEDGPRYAGGAKRGGMASDALTDSATGVVGAVEALRGNLRRGDVVLVKGARAQRLDRVSLALADRPVRCELTACQAKATRCDGCPMLERGWDGRAPVV